MVIRYLMIGIGGFLGAMARYHVTALVQRTPTGFPWGTFVVNISGCLLMGVATTVIGDRLAVHPNWRFLVPIGFIGAYTTFSTFELELFRATSDAAWMTALAYTLASVIVGYVALIIGVSLGRLV